MAAGTVPLEKRASVQGNQGTPVVLYALLASIALLAFTYQARALYDVFSEVRRPVNHAEPPFGVSANHFEIDNLTPEAEAAGLRRGDRVMVFGESALLGINDLFRKVAAMHPGQSLRVQVMRSGKMHTATLELSAGAHADRAVDLALNVILGFLMPWFSVTLGIYIAAARVRDRLAWVVMGLMLTFTGIVNTSIYSWGAWIRIPSEIFHTLLSFLFPTFLFLFGYYFPEPVAMDRRSPRLKWIIVGPLLLFALVGTPLTVGAAENLHAVQDLLDRLYIPRVFGLWISIAAILSSFVLLGMKAKRTSNKDARRRMRLLLAGIIFSLAPIMTVAAFSATTKRNFDSLPAFVVVSSILMIALFPITLAYVILVNRAMDVRVVLRQSLQYAFARSGVVVLRVLTLAVFGIIGYALAATYARNVVAQILLALGLLGAVLALNVTMRRLGLMVDRRFFRDQYNAEQILSELSYQVSLIREPEPLAAKVSGQIASALHVSQVAFVLEANGCFETCHAIGFDGNPKIRFGAHSGLVAHLTRSKDPQRVYFDDENSWLYRAPDMDDEQRSRLAYLGSELLLPLSSRDHLLGFISAGQKRSEEPYSKSDIRVLSSVASQAGLALENAKLTTAIAAEMAQRERLAREVEIAREVQERLFPQTLPVIETLDYAGFCRTALGVGGDYYDFLALPEGRLGFAVGDVAGKGISAALLMASLQASLRGETSHGTSDLAGMIGNLNKRVFEASTSNRYATFFYGQYTPESRTVEYVNAGHNPPILMRREGSGWEVAELAATGTVVGLIVTSEYEQAAVALCPGDYLVAFTDGISEAMNGEDEEWGEERLTETIRACAEASLGANETLRRILSAADSFVAGAKQHDDMTIIVLRVAG